MKHHVHMAKLTLQISHHSLYGIQCLLLIICYSLFVTRYLLLVICYLLFVTCYLLLVICNSLIVTSYLLLLICYSLFVSRYLILVSNGQKKVSFRDYSASCSCLFQKYEILHGVTIPYRQKCYFGVFWIINTFRSA